LYAPNLTLIRCVCHSAVNRIHNQWLELKTHFGIVRDKEKCYTAQILFEMYFVLVNYLAFETSFITSMSSRKEDHL
jgi:hypothetical protein